VDLWAVRPDFGVGAAVIAVGLLGYALVVEPLWGRWEYRRLAGHRGAAPTSLTHLYRVTLVVQWSWTLLVLAAVAVAPGLRAADVGVTAPEPDVFAYAIAGGMAAGLFGSTVAMRAKAKKGASLPGVGAYSELLPRTRVERRYALALAVTAGVCEELLYRGFFVATGIGLFGLPVWAAAGGAAVVFLVGHLYQGWRGMLVLAPLTMVFTVLYLASGSLLLPILLHILIDIRSLLLVPALARTGPPATLDTSG
jgi:membrane protease YdiL (CAAX protease family)